MHVYLNGAFVPLEQASISAQDAGFQHAVGLFETMGAYHGRVFRVQSHLARLNESAKILGLTRELDTRALAEAIQETLTRNKLDRARVRLTLTAGPVSLLRPPDKNSKPPLPTLLIVASEPIEYDPAYFEQGITVMIAPPAANPFDPLAGHKTLSYWGRLRTLRQAATAGAHEAIWLNVSNHLASGCVSNLFIIKDQVLLTPYARGEEVEGALPAPVLPGTTRAAVIEMAQDLNIPVQRQMLSINDLLEADEVFLTNAGWLVLPVTQVEKQSINAGKVGAITQQLRSSLLDVIEMETSDDE